MKHWCGPIAKEPERQRIERKAFERWMNDHYPGLVAEHGLQPHPRSGYYVHNFVNCCWMIWLHRAGVTQEAGR